jgi:hypothetical protein
MPTLDQGWAALLGAVVGGLFTLGGTLITGRISARAAKREHDDVVAATALLMQDDFLHYQATLARALDVGVWWDASRLLPPQSNVDDRKMVWAALDTPSTNCVAGAQGWMDVLIQHRETLPHHAPLSADDVGRLRDVFCELEKGRQALAGTARRVFAPFEKSGVLKDLTTCKTMQALLGKPSCFP